MVFADVKCTRQVVQGYAAAVVAVEIGLYGNDDVRYNELLCRGADDSEVHLHEEAQQQVCKDGIRVWAGLGPGAEQLPDERAEARSRSESELDDTALPHPAAGLGEEVGVHAPVDSHKGALPALPGAGAVVCPAAAIEPHAVVFSALNAAPVHNHLALAKQRVAQQRRIPGIDVDAAARDCRGGQADDAYARVRVELRVG